jgi:hypothetical protein
LQDLDTKVMDACINTDVAHPMPLLLLLLALPQ